MAEYILSDEPVSNPLTRFVVAPVIPFLAALLAGPIVAWPWFVFNHAAIGQRSWYVSAIIALVAWLALFLVAANLSLYPDAYAAYGAYVGIGLRAAKLAVAYLLLFRQSVAYDLHTYFAPEGSAEQPRLFPIVGLAGGMFLTQSLGAVWFVWAWMAFP